MYNFGDILKHRTGTSTNQSFIMLLDTSEYYRVTLFDNLFNSKVGDQSRGFDIEDYEISSLRELSDFVISNNI